MSANQTAPLLKMKSLLSNPSSIRSRTQAKQLHAIMIIAANGGPSSSPSLNSAILSIYSNLNLLHDSLIIFNTLHSPSIDDWKSIIKCYASHGRVPQCVAYFNQMRASGQNPDHNVFPSILKACTFSMDLRFGESVHGCIMRLGMEFDLYTGNALMNMYSKFQNLDGRGGQRFSNSKMFGRIPVQEPINGLVSCSNSGSLICTSVDRQESFRGHNIGRPCDSSFGIVIGENDGSVAQKMNNVLKVFDMMPRRDVVSWNTVIAGHGQNGMYFEALTMLRKMGDANLKPDSFTLSSVLPIFAEYVNVRKGKEIHGYAVRNGFDTDVFIGSGLIDMYAKCARLEDSKRIFHLLPQRDSILWNSVIAGCVQNGLFDEGLKFFREMLMVNIKPGCVSISSIMPACAYLTTLHLGKQLHGYITRIGFDDNVFIASSLVDMYAKCGNIRVGRWIFDNMQLHDMVSWTAMIMGYAVHGHAHYAVSLFEQMTMEGVKPNSVAFLAVLTACSHAGLKDEAWRYFESMTQDYGFTPGLEHCAAMADLLGRVGQLQEAFDFISRMPVHPTGSVWSTLLSACAVHKNIDMAKKVAGIIFNIDPYNMGAYVLLSNVYSAAGRWREAAKLRTIMRDKGMKKNPGYSWIEVNNEVQPFYAGDESHPDYDRIIEVLDVLLEQMEHEGYVPDTEEVVHS